MTSQHITLTEEVQKDGQLVTQERVTLQTTPDPADMPIRTQAYSVNHPDYVGATERVYTYDEELGMSRSEAAPRLEAELETEETESVAEDGDDESETEDDEDEEVEADEEESVPAICHHPVGNGECQLPEGHEGQHRLNID